VTRATTTVSTTKGRRHRRTSGTAGPATVYSSCISPVSLARHTRTHSTSHGTEVRGGAKQGVLFGSVPCLRGEHLRRGLLAGQKPVADAHEGREGGSVRGLIDRGAFWFSSTLDVSFVPSRLGSYSGPCSRWLPWVVAMTSMRGMGCLAEARTFIELALHTRRSAAVMNPVTFDASLDQMCAVRFGREKVLLLYRASGGGIGSCPRHHKGPSNRAISNARFSAPEARRLYASPVHGKLMEKEAICIHSALGGRMTLSHHPCRPRCSLWLRRLSGRASQDAASSVAEVERHVPAGFSVPWTLRPFSSAPPSIPLFAATAPRAPPPPPLSDIRTAPPRRRPPVSPRRSPGSPA